MSSLTTIYVYADNESQDNHIPSKKYGLYPETWEEFAASCKTLNWQVRCGHLFLYTEITNFKFHLY